METERRNSNIISRESELESLVLNPGLLGDQHVKSFTKLKYLTDLRSRTWNSASYDLPPSLSIFVHETGVKFPQLGLDLTYG